MTYQHQELTNGRWNKLSLEEQMANIGAEVGRAINWKKKGNEEYSKKAFYRALELVALTKKDPKHLSHLKEITRLYEVLGDYFVGDNQYGSTEENWNSYFYPFNYAARTI